MSIFSYPVLSPADGSLFSLFLIAAVALPLGVLGIYLLLNRFFANDRKIYKPLHPLTLPKILFTLLLLTIVSPFVYYPVYSLWSRFTGSINRVYLSKVPEIIRKNTAYTNVKICNDHYVSIVSPYETFKTRKQNFLEICTSLQKYHFSKILAQHAVDIMIWDYEGCVKSFWDINKQKKGYWRGICYNDGNYSIPEEATQ